MLRSWFESYDAKNLGLLGNSIRCFGELISYVWNQKTIIASQ